MFLKLFIKKNCFLFHNFYNSFIDDIKQLSKEKSIEEITKDLNKKLDDLIKKEKYEEAARVRDYMTRNSIKRNF